MQVSASWTPGQRLYFMTLMAQGSPASCPSPATLPAKCFGETTARPLCWHRAASAMLIFWKMSRLDFVRTMLQNASANLKQLSRLTRYNLSEAGIISAQVQHASCKSVGLPSAPATLVHRHDPTVQSPPRRLGCNSMCMGVHVCACLCACVHMHTCIYRCKQISIYRNIHICTSVYIYIYIYICVCVCVCICV